MTTRATSLALALFMAATPAAAQQTNGSDPAPEIREWPVPWEESRPRDPFVAPDGRVWFVGQRSDYVAVLDPQTGDFRRLELDAGTGPHNLIVGEDGTIWYAGNRAAHIGVMDPESGAIEKIAMPDGVRDPHTLVWGRHGDIWFTAQGANVVGHLDTATREVRVVEVPTARARPYGIVVDASNRPWIAQVGSNRIGTVDPATLAYEEIVLPREDARPRRIALTTDGGVWYVDYAGGYLGHVDPETREIREWPAPSGAGSGPYAMAVDARDRLWFFETGVQPNALVGFDPATESWLPSAEVPSGGGTVRHMVYHAESHSLWFGTDTNTIGRATLP